MAAWRGAMGPLASGCTRRRPPGNEGERETWARDDRCAALVAASGELQHQAIWRVTRVRSDGSFAIRRSTQIGAGMDTVSDREAQALLVQPMATWPSGF